MGQKVSPIGLRIGVNKSWQSNWYAEGKSNAKYIKNDDMKEYIISVFSFDN